MPDYSNHRQRFQRVVYPGQCIRTSRNRHFHSYCPDTQDSPGRNRQCYPDRQGCSRNTSMTGIARQQKRSCSRSCPCRLYMSCRCRLLEERSQYARLLVCNACMRNVQALTSAVVGARVLVGAVLLALSTPYLCGGICDEDGGSSQGGSSVGKHVVMLHNSTI